MTSKRKALLRQYLIILVAGTLFTALLAWGFYAAMSATLSEETNLTTGGTA